MFKVLKCADISVRHVTDGDVQIFEDTVSGKIKEYGIQVEKLENGYLLDMWCLLKEDNDKYLEVCDKQGISEQLVKIMRQAYDEGCQLIYICIEVGEEYDDLEIYE